MKIQNYPTLLKGLIEMAYDNGVVNRTMSENLVVSHASKMIAFETTDTLDIVEADLARLTQEELETVVAGDQDDPIVATLKPATSRILNHLFENLVP